MTPASGESSFELAPARTTVRDFTRSVARWFWIPALFIAAGFAIPQLLQQDEPTGQTATAYIGLTTNVEWPFYSAVRERAMALSDEYPIQEVTPDLAEKIVDVSLHAPPNEAFVVVEVTATDLDSAIIAADSYTERIVALDAENRQADIVRRAEVFRETFESLEAQIEDVDQRLEELIRAEGVAEAGWTQATATGEGIEQARQEQVAASQAIQNARAERDRYVRSQNSVAVDQIGAEVDAASAPTDIERLRGAQGVDEPVSRLWISSILGALAGAAAGMVVVWLVASEWGRIDSADSLFLEANVPAVDFDSDGLTQLRLWLARIHDGGPVAITGSGTTSELIYDELQRSFPQETVLQHGDLLAGERGRVTNAVPMMRLEGPDVDAVDVQSALDTALHSAEGPTIIDVGDPHGIWFSIASPLCTRSIVAIPAKTTKRALKDLLLRLRRSGLQPNWLVVVGASKK